jgi:multidrug resistance efflux pump
MLVLVNVANPGARIKKGDLVAEFDRQYQLLRLDDYRASVHQYESNVKKLGADLMVAREAHEQLARVAKADLEKALLDLKTIEVRSEIEAEKFKLAVEEAKVSHQETDAEMKLVDVSQRAELRAAEIDRDQTKIELRRAEANVDRMVTKAPIDGIVVMQTIWRGGDFGQVQQGDQIYPGMFFMSIVDPSSMVLNATVNQVDSEELRVGMKASVRLDAYPDLVLRGKVIGIGAMTKTGGWRANYVREIPIRLKLEETDPRVLPDLSASAEILLEDAQQAVIAPMAGIFRDNGKPSVFVQTPAGWVHREVGLGVVNHVAAVVRSGLQKGDVIALQRPLK